MKKHNVAIIVLLCVIGGVIVFSSLIVSPAKTNTDVPVTHPEDELPYAIHYPEKTIELPAELGEISGISYYRDSTLACIEDENGIIYLINYETGKITGRHEFGKERDYEDIEIVQDTDEVMKTKTYVLLNTGTIYRIKRLGLTNQKVKKYQTFLNRRNDAEGLCYHRGMNALLIACKGSTQPADTSMNNHEQIYAFNLNEKILEPEPLITIHIDVVREKTGNILILQESIQPSGIAVHPLSGNIYIISSAEKLLLVADTKGNIVSVTELNRLIFMQPEGICFHPDGDMFISNEGRGGRANILKFRYGD